MLRVEVIGGRALSGRFASLRDGGFREMQLVEAASLGKTIQDIYRHYAPKSRGHSATGRHFFEGLTGRAVATSGGFEVRITTDNPKLREWLKHGTGVYAGHGRIYPKHGHALGPIFNWLHPAGGTGPFWFHSIAGMRANPWEVPAQAEALGLGQEVGRRVGRRVTAYLAGH